MSLDNLSLDNNSTQSQKTANTVCIGETSRAGGSASKTNEVKVEEKLEIKVGKYKFFVPVNWYHKTKILEMEEELL